MAKKKNKRSRPDRPDATDKALELFSLEALFDRYPGLAERYDGCISDFENGRAAPLADLLQELHTRAIGDGLLVSPDITQAFDCAFGVSILQSALEKMLDATGRCLKGAIPPAELCETYDTAVLALQRGNESSSCDTTNLERFVDAVWGAFALTATNTLARECERLGLDPEPLFVAGTDPSLTNANRANATAKRLLLRLTLENNEEIAAAGDGTPGFKPGGWTKSELVEQAAEGAESCSNSTFDNIRRRAGVRPSERGGVGQQRRYSRAEVRRLAEAAEKGRFRDGRRIAHAWQELFGDSER